MSYEARFYSLSTWDVEEVRVFHSITDAKLAARGRLYTLLPVPDRGTRATMDMLLLEGTKMAAEAVSLGLFMTGLWTWMIGW